MSADNIQSVTLGVGYDGRAVTNGLRRLDSQVASFASRATRLLAPVTALFAGGRLFGNFVDTRRLGYLSRELGASVEDISAWGNAVRDAGGDAESLGRTLSALSSDLSGLLRLGNSRTNSYLRFLGISALDENKQLRSTTDILLDLSDAAERFGTRQFISIAKRMGIDPGTIQLILRGRREVEKLVSAQRGFATTAEDAEAAQNIYTSYNRLGRSAQFAANRFLRFLEPAITTVLDKLTTSVKYIIDNEHAVYGLAGAFGLLAATKVPGVLTGVLNVLRGIPAPAAATGLAFAAVGTAAFLVADDIYTGLTGGESYTRNFLSFLESEYPKTYTLLAGWNDAFWDGVISTYDRSIPYLKERLTEFTDFVATAYEAIFENQNAASRAFNGIVDSVFGEGASEKTWDTVYDAFVRPITDNGVDAGVAGILSTAGDYWFGNGTSSTTSVDIDTINVNTQATDATGIATSIDDALTRTITDQASFVNMVN